MSPPWIARVTHPLIIVVGAALSALLWLARRRRVTGLDALLLLALLFHLRCVLDTWDSVYYAVPFLLALVAWEGLARRRPPVASLLVTVAVWVVFRELPNHGVSPDAQSVAYLAWALPAAGALTVHLFAPRVWERIRRTSVQLERPPLALPATAAE